jgi:hypothetical protein
MNKSVVFLVFAAGLSFASGDDRGQDVDVDVDVDTITDVNINPTMNSNSTMNANSSMTNSTSSRAYGFGLGDVDIAQCYRSYQLLIWQDSKINPFCVADSYDQKGLHVMAAVIRCDIGFIRKHFASTVECVDANTMFVAPPPVVKTVAPHESFEEHIVVEERHDTELEDLRQEQVYQFQEIEERLDEIDVARRGYAEDQRQKRVYAKGLLEQLEQRNDNGNDPED